MKRSWKSERDKFLFFKVHILPNAYNKIYYNVYSSAFYVTKNS